MQKDERERKRSTQGITQGTIFPKPLTEKMRRADFPDFFSTSRAQMLEFQRSKSWFV